MKLKITITSTSCHFSASTKKFENLSSFRTGHSRQVHNKMKNWIKEDDILCDEIDHLWYFCDEVNYQTMSVWDEQQNQDFHIASQKLCPSCCKMIRPKIMNRRVTPPSSCRSQSLYMCVPAGSRASRQGCWFPLSPCQMSSQFKRQVSWK